MTDKQLVIKNLKTREAEINEEEEEEMAEDVKKDPSAKKAD